MSSDDRGRSSATSFDAFGFELPELTPAQAAARAACHSAASRREARAEWASIDRDRTLPGHAELKKLARKGIPARLRPWVWSAASGALSRRAEHGKDYYPAMVMMGEGQAQATTVATTNGSPHSSSSAVGRQVDLDLPRTFPGNARVEACLPALRRVLLAFASHAPQVGYCQSMNFVAALLLVAAVVADDNGFEGGDDDSWFDFGAAGGDDDEAMRRRRQRRQGYNIGNSAAITAIAGRGRDRPPPPPSPLPSSPTPPPRAPTAREEEAAFWLLVSLADDSEAAVTTTTTTRAATSSSKSATEANGRGRGRGIGFGIGGGGRKKADGDWPGSDGGGGDVASTSSPRSTRASPSPLPPPILPPGMYGRDLLGCRVELRALADGIRSRNAKLARHVLDDLGCDASLLATDWFLCLFATSLPAETVARVWDSLFVEGNKVLHRIALALLLRRHSGAMMAASSAGTAMRAARDGAAAEHDAEGLMRTCFEGLGPVPMLKIDAARQAARKEVEAEVWGRQAARRAAAEARRRAIGGYGG